MERKYELNGARNSAVLFKQTMMDQRTVAMIKVVTNLSGAQQGVVLDGSSLCKCSVLLVDIQYLAWVWDRLLLAFAVYFVLGAYYNYSNYGASGADLIP